MLGTWNAVATLDRMLNDVKGAALGTAVSDRAFDPAIDVRASDTDEVSMSKRRSRKVRYLRFLKRFWPIPAPGLGLTGGAAAQVGCWSLWRGTRVEPWLPATGGSPEPGV